MFSYLEEFPIEIFHQIFSYLWAHEILCSFHNINNYLNNIITHYDQYMVNLESIRKSHFNLVCRHIRAEQMISLIVSDASKTPNQSDILQSIFPIEQFTRLRALKLIDVYGRDALFFFELYKIPHLVSLEINVGIGLPFIARAQPLKRLIINMPQNVYFNIETEIKFISFQQMRQLCISNISCTRLKQIFSHATQLTSLDISFQFLNTIDCDMLADIHQGQLNIPPLKALFLKIDTIAEVTAPSHIEAFLAPFSCLREFELVINPGVDSEFADALRWELFIVKYLPKLSKFNFKFSLIRLDRNVLTQFSSSFWLNRRWFVATDLDGKSLFTVPHFAPTKIIHAIEPVLPECTTLPMEEHITLYDHATELFYESDEWKLPYRYNHIERLILNDPYMQENIVDLSRVKSLHINTSDWSFYMILTLIKDDMPAVNYLSLNCIYTDIDYEDFPEFSLPQIRTLCLPQYEDYLVEDTLHLSQFFPCVERLKVSINSKRQIPFLIDHFQNLTSGFFYIHSSNIDLNLRTRMTRQWLKKHTRRLQGVNMDNFVCQIEDKYFFQVSIWIGDNDKVDEKVTSHRIRKKPSWHQRFRWHSTR